MMSQKMMSGWWSVILDSASNPSSARITWQPAWARKISALRRMVFESSITITLIPARVAVSLNVWVPFVRTLRKERGGRNTAGARAERPFYAGPAHGGYEEIMGSANYLTRFLKCGKPPKALSGSARARANTAHPERELRRN